MKDKLFKNLLHSVEGYAVLNSGGQLTKGYKPGTVLQKGNECIIMECDTGTGRKIRRNAESWKICEKRERKINQILSGKETVRVFSSASMTTATVINSDK